MLLSSVVNTSLSSGSLTAEGLSLMGRCVARGAQSVMQPLRLTQEYKVSSCEQRLISEIEYRLERSPVEESGDEAPCGDTSVESGVAPFFEVKLKHYKIFEGMPATFTCRVAGDPKPKVSGDTASSDLRALSMGLAPACRVCGRRTSAGVETECASPAVVSYCLRPHGL